MSTKQQEREALAKIRKIVESLGDDSYISFAFEGCFEIAASNIENDFADSMKQRAESAERKVEELQNKLAESEKDYEAAHAAAHVIAEQKDAEIATLKGEIAVLQRRILSQDDLYDFEAMVDNQIAEYEEEMKEAAAVIVNHAEHPEEVTFLDAVRVHRNAKRSADFGKGLKARIHAAMTAGA